MPVLERSFLEDLAAELSLSAAAGFADNYRRMLPQRVNRIIDALTRGDLNDAMDAVLSLKISSAMIGAQQLEDRCLCLQRNLRQILITRGETDAGIQEWAQVLLADRCDTETALARILKRSAVNDGTD